MLNTDPSLVTFEIDVHWALEGLNYNQDALVAFLRKYSKRISMLHVKGSDPTQNPGTIPSTDFARITDAGGPKDVTDWKRIFEAAADVDYYHWEYDMSPDAFASSKVASNAAELHHVRQGPRRVGRRRRHGAGDALADAGRRPRASARSSPGVARDYTASTTANVISTAGDATLTLLRPGPPDQRRVLAHAAAAGHALEVDLERAGLQRPGDDRLQAGDRRQRGAAHRAPTARPSRSRCRRRRRKRDETDRPRLTAGPVAIRSRLWPEPSRFPRTAKN